MYIRGRGEVYLYVREDGDAPNKEETILEGKKFWKIDALKESS